MYVCIVVVVPNTPTGFYAEDQLTLTSLYTSTSTYVYSSCDFFSYSKQYAVRPRHLKPVRWERAPPGSMPPNIAKTDSLSYEHEPQTLAGVDRVYFCVCARTRRRPCAKTQSARCIRTRIQHCSRFVRFPIAAVPVRLNLVAKPRRWRFCLFL